MRVDTGVRQGDTVTPFYDPMIAKVIVHDRDRASAMRRMASLMAATEVVGVTTNAALLQALCSHPAFVGGEVDTGFIERHRGDLFPKAAPADDRTLRGGDPGAPAGMAGGGDAVRARSPFAVGPADRLPPARRRSRRGALEGRRARGRRDRPPSARRQPPARTAGRPDRRDGATRRRRPTGDRPWPRHDRGQRRAPCRARRRHRLYGVRRRGRPAPAAGRSARRHAIRGDGGRRDRRALAAARQDHRPARSRPATA